MVTCLDVPRLVVRFLLGLLALGCWAPSVWGEVIVISNRTEEPMAFELRETGQLAVRHELAAKRQMTVFARRPVQIKYARGKQTSTQILVPNHVYFFAQPRQLGEPRVLVPLELGAGQPIAAAARAGDGPIPTLTIPVRILVDQNEPAADAVWQKRLTERVQRASEVLEAHCRVKLKVVGYARWVSNDMLKTPADQLHDFEQKVGLPDGELAIGFAGRARADSESVHLGMGRGPFRRHLLVREWKAGLSEPERLEILLHELGHHFGAVHTPDPESVMRPNLADGKALLREFHIGFDAPNTLIMNLVADQYREGIDDPARFPPDVRLQLGQLYEFLASGLPDDRSTRAMLELVTAAPDPAAGANRAAARGRPDAAMDDRPLPAAPQSPLGKATREILDAMHAAAAEHLGGGAKAGERLSGNELTDHLVRRAASVAERQAPPVRERAFLMALGIGLGNVDFLRGNPLAKAFVEEVEPAALGRGSIAVSMHGRRDLAQHFFVTVYLSAAVGGPLAEAAGLAKELADAEGGSGFSFADLAADFAGSQFASWVIDGRLPLDEIATTFTTTDFTLGLEGLEENLSSDELERRYGAPDDERFRTRATELKRRLQSLPPYQRKQQSAE